MFHEGHLLLVLHELPAADEVTRDAGFFWRRPDGTWASTTRHANHMAVDAHLGEYEATLNALDEAEERSLTANEYFELMQHLNPLVRATRNLHATLQQAREMVPEDRRIINYRDRSYAIERRAELLAGDARNALDYAIARKSEEHAENSKRMSIASHRLNVMAAFFFPIATLCAIFGVNLRHGLEPDRVDHYWPFVAVLGVGLLAGVILTLFVTRIAGNSK